MKSIVKQLTAITFISLFIIALNVKAEGTESIGINHEIIEKELELENWMTDESTWSINSAILTEIVQETELIIEDWMISETNWFIIPEEKESDLEIEHWMISESYWN